jgi:hypothetical protein
MESRGSIKVAESSCRFSRALSFCPPALNIAGNKFFSGLESFA